MEKIIIFIIFLLITASLQGVVYKKPREHFNPKIEVAALFIEHENRILLLHRQKTKLQGNLWGIPGGKLDKGETPLQAVLREIKEETGYDFAKQPIENLGAVYIEYNDNDLGILLLLKSIFVNIKGLHGPLLKMD